MDDAEEQPRLCSPARNPSAKVVESFETEDILGRSNNFELGRG